MTTCTFLRWSGLAAVFAGLVTAAGPLLGEVRDPAIETVGLVIRTALIAVALVGIFLFQRERAGVLGLIGALIASAGNLLILVNFFIGGALYSSGLIVLAIASFRARTFPRWVPVFWILTVALGFPGFFIESLAATAFAAGAVSLGLAFIGAGYTIWSRAGA